MGIDGADGDLEDGGNFFGRDTLVVIKLQKEPVTWGQTFKGLGKP